ncbi:hypothetical protein, partial [Acinetobacter baumannii]|uniref:hypothetical protein n=1 Tax=Acinetobacter baumannii TaxID=470 RepID=UPI001BC87BE1
MYKRQVYCGNTRDHIYYYKGDGNETVYNFKASDSIYLYDGVKFKNATLNGNDVVVNLDSGNTITLKDARNENISIGDTTGSYSIG